MANLRRRGDPTGQTVMMTGNQLVHALNSGLYEPVDPDERVSTATLVNGEWVPELVPLRDLPNTATNAGGLGSFMVISDQQATSLVTDASRRRRREWMEQQDLPVAALEFGSTLAFGLPDLAVDALDPSGYNLYREAVDANPGSALLGQAAGIVLPLLIPGGQAEAAAGAGGKLSSMMRLLRTAMGPAGLAERIAPSARMGAERLMLEMGISPRGARIAGSLADNLTQEAIVSTGWRAREAMLRDEPLLAETILADAGVGTVLGFGIEGVVSRLARGLRGGARAARETPGGEMADEMRGAYLLTAEDAARMTDEERYAWELANTEQQQPGFLSGTLGLGAGIQNTDDLMRIGSPELRARVRQAEQRLDGMVAETADKMRFLDEMEKIATEPGRRLERLNQYDDVFGEVPTAVARAGAVAVADDVASVVQAARETGQAMGRSSDALNAMDQAVSLYRTQLMRANTSREVFEASLNYQENVWSISQSTEAFVAGADKVTPATQAALAESARLSDQFTNAPNLWGRLGSDQHERDLAIRAFLQAREDMKGLLEPVKGLAGTNEARLRRAVELGERSSGTEIRDKVANYFTTADTAVEVLGRRAGLSEDQYQVFRRGLNEAKAAWSNTSVLANNLMFFNSIRRLENINAGALTAMGLTGAGVGALVGSIGGPGGAVAGALLGGAMALGWTALTKPASMIARLNAVENLVEAATKRRLGFTAGLRQRLGSGWTTGVKSKAARLAPAIVYGFRREGPREGEAITDPFSSLGAMQDSFLSLREELLRVTASPEAMADEVSMGTASAQALGEWGGAPGLGINMMARATAAAGYLAQTIPDVVPDPLFPLEPAQLPSYEEMEAFINRYRAVEDPMGVFERFLQGSVSAPEIEAVQQVYPELYAQALGDIIDVLSVMKPADVPYEARLDLGNILGLHTADPTLSTEFLLTTQNPGFQTPQQARAAGRPRSPSAAQQRLSISVGLTDADRTSLD